MGLMDSLSKVGKKSVSLAKAEVYQDRELTNTDFAAVNIALSGDVDGGIGSGVTVFAGPSKHFKSNTALLCIAAYLRKFPEAICLFYDSEFGSPPNYWSNFGIDITRVLHVPIQNLEELKFDLPQKLEEIKTGDKVFIFVDSVGNLASKKEATDAVDGKSTTDMTRAREMKSLFRIVTPLIKTRNLPSIFIAHTYQTMEMFSKAVVSGGTGIYYSADTIIIFGRQQEKDGTEIMGYNFILNVDKSRFVREKSKIPLSVFFDKGIVKYSGMLDLTLESGDVIKPKNGYYQLVDRSTGELLGTPIKEKLTYSDDFLGVAINRTEFKTFIKEKYQLSNTMTEADIESDLSIQDEEDFE